MTHDLHMFSERGINHFTEYDSYRVGLGDSAFLLFKETRWNCSHKTVHSSLYHFIHDMIKQYVADFIQVKDDLL